MHRRDLQERREDDFRQGVALKDPSGLFNSSLEGNTRRAINIHEDEGVDEAVLKALVRAAAALNASKKKKATLKKRCMERLSPADLTEVLTGVVSSALSASEIAETEAFYSTAVGRKSVQVGVDQLRQKFGDATVGPIPPSTAEDEAATRKFSQTPAGKKLFVDKVLQTGPAMGALRARILSLMVACGKKG